MSKLKASIFMVSMFALILGVVAIETPKAVHAAIATFIRDQDNAARHPFGFTCFALASGGGLTGTGCNIGIPSAAEYVIQNVLVVGDCQSTVSCPSTTRSEFTTGKQPVSIFSPITQIPATTSYYSTWSGTIYADPGTTFIGQALGNANNVTIYIHGYYVTLP